MNRDYIINVTISENDDVISKYRFASNELVHTKIASVIYANDGDNRRIVFDCTHGDDFIRFAYEGGEVCEYVLGNDPFSGNTGFKVQNCLLEIRHALEQFKDGSLSLERTPQPKSVDAHLYEKADYTRECEIKNKEDNAPLSLSALEVGGVIPLDIRMLHAYSGLNPANKGYPTADLIHLLPDAMRPKALTVKERPAGYPHENLFLLYDVSCVIGNTKVSCTYQYLKEYVEIYGRPGDVELAADLFDDYLVENIKMWQARRTKAEYMDKAGDAEADIEAEDELTK